MTTRLWKEFQKGLLREHPIFVLTLGLCPVLAVTTQVVNAIGMGAGVLFVLFCSNLTISLIKDYVPSEVHIPAYIVIIASFVTIVDLLMQAYAPTLSKNLGVFVPLIVVNCIILGRAEAFASRNSLTPSLFDGLGMGVGFTIGLIVIAFVRETLGAGTITLFPMGSFDGVVKLPGLFAAPARVMILSAGALLALGYLKALSDLATTKKGTSSS